MRPMFDMLADKLVGITRTTVKPGRSAARVISNARRALIRAGFAVDPVGAGNVKTGSVGTYRRVGVGAGCPTACPHTPRADGGDGTCYATGGNVRMAATRSGARPTDSAGPAGAVATAAAVAVALATVEQTGRPFRVNVSGDFALSDGQRADRLTVEAVCAVIRAARKGGTLPDVVGWGYTAIPGDEGAWVVDQLRAVGVVVRRSGLLAPGGAVVTPRHDAVSIRAARERAGARVIPCLAQVGKGRACADCGACWTQPERVVLFAAHGMRTREAARAAGVRLGIA